MLNNNIYIIIINVVAKPLFIYSIQVRKFHLLGRIGCHPSYRLADDNPVLLVVVVAAVSYVVLLVYEQ